MDVSQWGPHAWFFLHSVTFYYPDTPTLQDKENINRFFNTVGDILPCEHCKKHYKSHLKKYPIESSNNSKYDVTNWLIHVHNEVNKSTGKPTMTYSEVLEYYKQFYNSKKSINSNSYIIITTVVITVVIMLIAYFIITKK